MENDVLSHNLHSQSVHRNTMHTSIPLFTIIESLCETEGAEGNKVYGIEMKCGDTVVVQKDIAAEYDRVIFLLELLKKSKGTLSLDHFFEICEDFVEFCSGYPYF